MAVQDEYKLDLQVFEGPLDLLLYLIRREEVDIYNIPIERVTTQYMQYLDAMRLLDLNIAGEFIVMAATLMMIKSRMLLPVEERPELEEEEEDPRWELVRQLVEYKKFKDAAAQLQEREVNQENVFGLGGGITLLEPDPPFVMLQDVSIFDLIAAFNEALSRARPEKISEIFSDRFSVADKIETILGEIAQRRTLAFREMFRAEATRPEIVCTFLALLELIRLRQVTVIQKERFGEILIAAAEETAPAPPASAEAEAGTDETVPAGTPA